MLMYQHPDFTGTSNVCIAGAAVYPVLALNQIPPALPEKNHPVEVKIVHHEKMQNFCPPGRHL